MNFHHTHLPCLVLQKDMVLKYICMLMTLSYSSHSVLRSIASFACIAEMRTWHAANHLNLDDEKTVSCNGSETVTVKRENLAGIN